MHEGSWIIMLPARGGDGGRFDGMDGGVENYLLFSMRGLLHLLKFHSRSTQFLLLILFALIPHKVD